MFLQHLSVNVIHCSTLPSCASCYLVAFSLVPLHKKKIHLYSNHMVEHNNLNRELALACTQIIKNCFTCIPPWNLLLCPALSQMLHLMVTPFLLTFPLVKPLFSSPNSFLLRNVFLPFFWLTYSWGIMGPWSLLGQESLSCVGHKVCLYISS